MNNSTEHVLTVIQICVKNVATGTIAVIKEALGSRFSEFGDVGQISVVRPQNEAYVTFKTTVAAEKAQAAYRERKVTKQQHETIIENQ